MLTPKYLQRIIEATERKTSQLNSYLTSKIVDRILTLFENTKEINVNPSSIHDAMKQEAAGKLFDEVQEEILRHLPIIQDEVRVAFMDAAGKINKDVYEFTRHIIDVEHEKGELLDVNIPELPEATDFEKVGIPQSAADLNLTPKEIRMLESAYNRTNGEIYNITQTTAAATQQTFIDACDNAYWKVAHGVSPSTAITEAIEEVSAKGITTVHYGSREDKIEVAIARAVRTGINQANGDIKLTRCAEMGVGYVRVNSHIGARVTKHEDYTNHSLWQGKVYKLDWSNPVLSKYQPTEQEIKENKKSFAFMDKIKKFFTGRKSEEEYEDFITVCGYGKMLGICGINCRHSFDPFYLGVNINTDKPIDPEKNRQRYELEHKQRAKEREIRELKRKEYAFDNAEPSDKQTKEAIEEKRKELKEKLTQKRTEYREFCKENRLSTENYRLQIAKKYGVSNNEKHPKVIELKEYRLGDKTYVVDGKHIVLDHSKHERDVATYMSEMFETDVLLIPRILVPEKIKTADYMINGKLYDLKEPRGVGKHVLYGMIKEKKDQAQRFIFDISNTALTEGEIVRQIKEDVFRSTHTLFVQEIVLIKDMKLLGIYHRK